MLYSGLGSNAIHSLSQAWSSESRGARLTSSDFETKTRIRTGPNPVEAVIVLPVAHHIAHHIALAHDQADITAAKPRILAQYPVYAAIAVDRQTLDQLAAQDLADHRFQTLSEAASAASALNRASENAYLNDYQSGQLSGIQSWQKTECEYGLEKSIAIRAAANQSLNI